MSEHPDPAGEAGERIGGYITLALTAAGRAMEIVVQRRQMAARSRERGDAEHARNVEAQLRADAVIAREQLRTSWARHGGIGRTETQAANSYAMARAYAPFDDQMAGMAQEMREAIQRRYGVDPDALVADVEARLAEQRAARATKAETAEAAALVGEANRVDAAVFADGKVTAAEAGHDLPVADAAWDDAGRRTALADRLLASQEPGQGQAVEARLIADGLQAKPAAAAPGAPAAAKAPKARNTPSRGAERQVGR